MIKSERNYSLDFLKILATIGIVFHHFQQATGTKITNFIDFFTGWFYWGYLVEFFFVLSGYFMLKYVPLIVSGEISLSSWYCKRAKRLLPLVAASAVIYEIFSVAYKQVYNMDWFGRKISLFGTVTTSLGIQEGGAFLNAGVNNPTWYISVLLICYALFFILTSIAARLKFSPMYVYIAMVFLGCSITKAELQLPFLNTQVARGYYAFFFGILLAMFIQKYGSKRRVIAAAGAIFTVIMYLFIWHHGPSADLAYILTFILYPSIIILFETKFMHRLFSSPFWGFWGKSSFSVYIWHNPINVLMYTIIGHFGLSPDFSKLQYVLIYALFIELFGVFSYLFIEKPLNKLADRILD